MLKRAWIGLCLLHSLFYAQNVTSSVNGVLLDQSGAAISGAVCTLSSPESGTTLKSVSEQTGLFTFPTVAAGTYNLEVKAPGFKSLALSRIIVIASERHALGNLTLQVGDVQQSVGVTAEAAVLQLTSSERSGLVTGTQVNDLALKGRDYLALMLTIPGVVDTVASREATSNTAGAGIYINGARDNTKNITVDGITAMDTGSNGSLTFEPNMDSIDEVRVLASNYQAEYGRNLGGGIMAITKSGSREFHGSGYDFYRHESLNANDFFNNRSGTPKLPYRYRISGYSLGGPIYIPRFFNTEKNKLFFFWSQEFTGFKQNYGAMFVNTPTALERSGDFSQSYNVNGSLVVIKDPQTGAPFPGNVIPKSRINDLGLAILNYYPLPNYTDPDPRNAYRWNYRSVYSGNTPRRNDMLRTDWNVSSTLQIYYRYGRDTDNTLQPWGGKAGSVNYLISPVYVNRFGDGHVMHATKTFSPTLVNEASFARSMVNRYFDYTDPSAVSRSKMGNLPYWFSHNNLVQNYIPTVQFGGQPANTIYANLPFPIPNWYQNPVYTFSDGLSKVWGQHNFKGGIYIQRNQNASPVGGNYSGKFTFAVNANNPLETGNSFANALLGNFYSYTEAQKMIESTAIWWDYEGYVQDNWRLSRRVTLDIGMRMYHEPPVYDTQHLESGFNPALWSRQQAPALYVPALVNGARVAMDPLTGATAIAPFIGQFVPGTGNAANGLFVGGVNGAPAGLITHPAISYAPRFGVAFDVFGNGRTAIRTGFGKFFDIMQTNPNASTIGNPPISYSPTQYFGNLSTYAQSGGVIGPSSLSTMFGAHKLPSMMNYSFGIQQRLLETVIDVSYVGSLGRNLYYLYNINPIPIGARFNPANADPSQGGKAPLPDNYLRPYYGFGDINVYDNGASSNYNSLQASINRRLGRGLQFGAAYTFSKALGVADSDTSSVSPYFPARKRNYGPSSFDRTHVLVINYLYDIPELAKGSHFRPAHWVFGGWQLSGITTMVSGAPFTPSFSTTNSADITGSTEGARIDVVGNPVLSKGDKTFYRNFNTAAFALPAVGTFGNAGVGILRGPGVNNWDMAASKRFPLFSESRFVQFRAEFFNVWNHTQFAGLYTTAQFNPAGQQLDPNFGAYSSSRPPRIVQLSLKAVF